MTNRPVSLLFAAAMSTMVACKAGSGPEVRADITTVMRAAQAPISACYENALKVNRRIKGYMSLTFFAEPSTGKFVGLQTLRDETNDPSLRQCVFGEVGKLKLTTPQKTKVRIDYPLHFTPLN